MQLLLPRLLCSAYQAAAVTRVVSGLTPRLLAHLTWALGQLQPLLKPKLQQRILKHSTGCLHVAGGQDVAQLLHGFAQLQVQPPPQWMHACHARVSQVGVRRCRC
jgi:hypothetical protein